VPPRTGLVCFPLHKLTGSNLDSSPLPENRLVNSPLDAITADEKHKSLWNTVLTTLPIVLTILATAFAGMSSSEMTQAMYYRSLASQHQSKAGDQWAFFQAKRIRGTSLEMTSELLQAQGSVGIFDETSLNQLLAKLEVQLKDNASGLKQIADAREQLAKLAADPSAAKNLTMFLAGTLPTAEAATVADANVRETLDAIVQAIARHKPDDETTALLRKLRPEQIDEAIRIAEQNTDTFDQATDPLAKSIDRWRAIFKLLNQAGRALPDESPMSGVERAFRIAVLDFDAKRYRQESNFNRRTAELYEVRVRRSGIESDRHRERSKMFFYSMLVAQVGVTIASLALARTQRKSLWLFAALAGMIAVALSTYVYVSL